jgi:hypothetical protein
MRLGAAHTRALMFEAAQIDFGHDAVERDRPHLSGPAAQQHRNAGAGHQVQAGEEHDLVEAEHRRARQHEPRQGAVAEPAAAVLVEQDDQDAVGKQDGGAPHHQRAHLVEKAEIGDPLRSERDQHMEAHRKGEREQQQVADQEAVDRLARDAGVLADIDDQKQHQLAGEQHGRARRGHDAERQRNVEDAGEIGFEKMHHPERAEERPDADARTGAKQRGEHCEIQDGIRRQQKHILKFRHRNAPHPPPESAGIPAFSIIPLSAQKAPRASLRRTHAPARALWRPPHSGLDQFQ